MGLPKNVSSLGGSGDAPAAKRAKLRDEGPVVHKVQFLSRTQREKNERREKETEDRKDTKKADEYNRRRKEFLMRDEIERNTLAEKEREQRERERRDREELRKKERELQKAAESEHTKKVSEGQTRSSLAELELLKLPETEVRARQAALELQTIKKHYLGLKEERRKVIKPSEKFRNIFNFEWDATEDTAREERNPLYAKPVEPQLLFGRGYRAGVDIREQRKVNNFYEELVKRRVEKFGEDSAAFLSSSVPQKEDIVMDEDEKPKKEKKQAWMSRDISIAEEKDVNYIPWREKELEEMDHRDWKIFREEFEIYIKGGRVPRPMRKWAEAPLPGELLDAIRKVGYENPTPIQMQSIPIAAEKRDMIGIAETGSGKTCAFMLPLLAYIKALPPIDNDTCVDGPYAMVLAPSRELVLQIEDETRKFAHYCKDMKMISLIGGRNAEEQGFKLRNGVELVIATPGRMLDALNRQYTVVNQCNYIVMDEADRMVEANFEGFITQIIDAMPTTHMKSENEDEALKQELEAKAGHRQYRVTHMFSATMPPAVERLARRYLRAPAFISIGDPGAGKKDIEQRVEWIPEKKKKERLWEILAVAEPPIILFVNQKKAADVLVKALNADGFNSASLHGGKHQEIREDTMTAFKEGEIDILVATDVAGRGIDVKGVKHVINFDMAKTIQDYTHRIGRTGRAGLKGTATTFITDNDADTFYDLKTFLEGLHQLVPYELEKHPMSKIKPGSEEAMKKKDGGGGVVYAK